MLVLLFIVLDLNFIRLLEIMLKNNGHDVKNGVNQDQNVKFEN